MENKPTPKRPDIACVMNTSEPDKEAPSTGEKLTRMHSHPPLYHGNLMDRSSQLFAAAHVSIETVNMVKNKL